MQVETSVHRDQLIKRQQENGGKYTMATVDALMARYEQPDSRNRWDTPHFLLHTSGDDRDDQHDHQVPFVDIDNALFKRAAPAPNLSTQSVSKKK